MELHSGRTTACNTVCARRRAACSLPKLTRSNARANLPNACKVCSGDRRRGRASARSILADIAKALRGAKARRIKTAKLHASGTTRGHAVLTRPGRALHTAHSGEV